MDMLSPKKSMCDKRYYVRPIGNVKHAIWFDEIPKIFVVLT